MAAPLYNGGMESALTIEDVLNAYANGLFPMAERADRDEFYWYDPPLRGQLPILELHIPARLARTVRAFPFDVKINHDFAGVIDGCAASTPHRPGTWINAPIRDLFIRLHRAGFAHSVECWQGGTLVGGLYGLALGGLFCGESMFSRARDASKIALVHLCARLWAGGFSVLDTQFVNDHLTQFGIYEIPRAQYLDRVRQALPRRSDFHLHNRPDLDEERLIHQYFAARRIRSAPDLTES